MTPRVEKARSEVAKVSKPDGGLFSLGWYLGWTPGDDSATLDGKFSIEELRAIADHMEKHSRLMELKKS